MASTADRATPRWTFDDGVFFRVFRVSPDGGKRGREMGEIDGSEGPGGRGEKEVIEALTSVRGIGEKMASDLYRKGIRSVKDLLSSPLVSEGVKLCAKYNEDLKQGVDMGTGEIIAEHISLLLLFPGQGLIDRVIPVGSYRRRKPLMKDLDLLIISSASDSVSDSGEVSGEMERLEEVVKVVKETLQKDPSFVGFVSSGKRQVDLLWKCRSLVRMVEITICLPDETGAALMSTTGPREFNIWMRKRAEKMGMKLNQKGLYRVGGKGDGDGEEVPGCKDETSIFSALGLPYFIPETRGMPAVIKQISGL